MTLLLFSAALLPVAAATALKGKWATFAAGWLWPFAWMAGAIRLAKPHSRWARRFYGEQKRARAQARASDRRQRALALFAFLLVAIPLSFVAAVGQAYLIPSSAMEPTLLCAKPKFGCSAETSDRVFAVRYALGHEPERGDIVALRSNAAFERRCGSRGVFVRRVVGMPGEVVEAHAGVVRVDGRPLAEPYARFAPWTSWAAASRRFGPVRIPPGRYFLLGDLRGTSCDSSVWGSAPRELLIAEVVARFWPPGRLGLP